MLLFAAIVVINFVVNVWLLYLSHFLYFQQKTVFARRIFGWNRFRLYIGSVVLSFGFLKITIEFFFHCIVPSTVSLSRSSFLAWFRFSFRSRNVRYFLYLCKLFFSQLLLLFFLFAFCGNIVRKFTGYLSFAPLFFMSLNFLSFRLFGIPFRSFFVHSLDWGIFLFVLSCWRYEVWCVCACVFGWYRILMKTHTHT